MAKLMENTIIPFQVSKGMIIQVFTENSFDRFHLNNGKREMETLKWKFIWIRRFKNLDYKQKLYQDVYESDEWINEIAPKLKN